MVTISARARRLGPALAFLTVLFTVRVMTQGQPAAEVLTNESVVEMVAAKVPKDLVLGKIASTRNAFDVTAKGLVYLHQQRVPSQTIDAVLRAADGKDVLDNDAIVYLVANKLPRALILAKIQASKPAFDLTSTGLVGLAANKVHQEIVKAMMAKTAPTPPPSPPPSASASARAPEPPPTTSPALLRAAEAPAAAPAPPARRSAAQDRPIGLYLEQGDVTPLQPTAFSMVNTGSVLKAAWTYGAARGSVKVVVKSPRATLRVSSAPSFLFYLNESALAGMSNPSEFVLARMKANRKERELVVGKGSAIGIGGSSGDVKAKDLMELQVESVRAGVFRVSPKAPFPPGEYCFYYPPGEGRLFDFGVD